MTIKVWWCSAGLSLKSLGESNHFRLSSARQKFLEGFSPWGHKLKLILVPALSYESQNFPVIVQTSDSQKWAFMLVTQSGHACWGDKSYRIGHNPQAGFSQLWAINLLTNVVTSHTTFSEVQLFKLTSLVFWNIPIQLNMNNIFPTALTHLWQV